jgi:hypothetical protein
MLNFDPDKNLLVCLFIVVFAIVVLYALWPYIICAVIVLALGKGFSSQRRYCKI